MKILVCISKTPDTTTKITFTDNNTKFNSDKVQFIINPYDEWYALVRAIEIKEQSGATVTVINVGGADCDAIIRKALAIGGDDAVRVDVEPEDAFFVADQIAQYAKTENYDIILSGKETLDYNGSQVGGMVAGLLDVPFISMASKLDMAGNVATVERDISGGKEIINVQTPFVISAAKGMAEARIPNMRGIMAARTKPIKVLEPFASEKFTSVKHYDMPKEKAGPKMISADHPEELVALLHNEAKVI
ncbi:MAG: electron transfer flavoprotein subunit beta/FixA family protein [Chitinophagaceae bacterium]|nr:electron transfer flavoprotein subunit beta/FixA family protein [Chitinophagaceae bacterium]